MEHFDRNLMKAEESLQERRNVLFRNDFFEVVSIRWSEKDISPETGG